MPISTRGRSTKQGSGPPFRHVEWSPPLKKSIKVTRDTSYPMPPWMHRLPTDRWRLTHQSTRFPLTAAVTYICRHCWHKTRMSNVFNAMYVDTVDTKHIYTFLPITFLIFNRFSIRKKFWKAETEGFLTIPWNTIYVDTVDTRHKYF